MMNFKTATIANMNHLNREIFVSKIRRALHATKVRKKRLRAIDYDNWKAVCEQGLRTLKSMEMKVGGLEHNFFMTSYKRNVLSVSRAMCPNIKSQSSNCRVLAMRHHPAVIFTHEIFCSRLRDRFHLGRCLIWITQPYIE